MTASTDRRAELLELLLRKRRQAEQAEDRITAQAWTGTAELPSQQSGLWLANQLGQGDTSYNMITVMRLRGPLDADALRTALAGLVERHEAFRTSFVELAGVPRMRVDPAPGQPWLERLDFTAIPEPARWQRALQVVTESCQRRVDLRSAPLLRVFLAKLADDDHLLGYLLHHIVGDGWSMPILVGELTERYRAAVEHRTVRLPELTVQPSDVYRWQRQRLTAEATQQRLGQWRAKLAGLPTLRLPSDRPRTASAGTVGGNLFFALPAGLLGQVDEYANRTGSTPFAVLLACYAVLMQQRSGQHDLAIGSVFSGRTRTEMEPLIGYFANTTVLRVHARPDQSADQLIRHCHDLVLDAQRMQDIPFADVVEAVAPAREPGANPLFQVSISLARGQATNSVLDLAGVRAEQVPVLSRGSRFDLSFQVTEQLDGSAGVVMEYAAELFDAPTMERLAADFRDLLETMLADPALTVGQLPAAAALTDPESSEPAEVEPIELRDLLLSIWTEVFGLAGDFSDDQSFFELGGTSLAAVRLRARILDEFGVDVPLVDLYASSSIAGLLPRIEAALAESPVPTS